MTSSEIRQSFLDFFVSKGHAIVPSSSLMPDAPNLLFTNAGMNQFVPYFLGERKPPHRRVANTQKCIRAGGKHNDLEDVGFDSYHQTFFEMLGNWSFDDFFKKESLEWSWELLTEVWKFPKERLYATVYQPGEGDPAEFDQEAWDIWAAIFEKAGLDPEIHIIKTDECFWAMGDTGPCGPCSEIHIDLTEKGDTKGKLVDGDSPYCMELWNNVFIQFNALPDGTFEPLKSKFVDTGMGFERIAGILATTENFTKFGDVPSNYNSDIFQPFFRKIESLSGKKYANTFPDSRENLSEQEFVDCAFRVLADHIRALSCSIADGILPGNEGRNYVLRRILRRAVLFGRRLGMETGFFEKLVEPVLETLGQVFPELVEQETTIRRVIRSEEEGFSRTLDRGIQLFEKVAGESASSKEISGIDAFVLYDTYGFPLDLTELLARERGLTVDLVGFEKEMEIQRTRARAAQQKSTISVQKDGEVGEATDFEGYDIEQIQNVAAKLTDIVRDGEKTYLVFDRTPFYAEMGGQIGDRGKIEIGEQKLDVVNTIADPHDRYLHQIKGEVIEIEPGAEVVLHVDLPFRIGVQRHHTATHLLNEALRTVLGKHVRQAGSLVTENRLRFDFTHFEGVKEEELRKIESIVNEKILDNYRVQTSEMPFDEKPENCIAVFGEKYGDIVRVVDIGGYSVELCGGTHVQTTSEIGLFKIVSESAIAAGIRRIEAVAGEAANLFVNRQLDFLASATQRLSCPPEELSKRLDQLLSQKSELEKRLKKIEQKAAGQLAHDLVKNAVEKEGLRIVAAEVNADSPAALRDLGAQVAGELGEGVVILGSPMEGNKVSVAAFASPKAIQSGYKAGDIIRQLTAELGGKGGGKPNFAMGGGTKPEKLKEALEKMIA